MKLTIFDNWHDGVKMLPETEQDAFYGGIARYMFDGTEPSMNGAAAVIWAVVKPMLDTSREGQENGAKGGNGRGNKTPSENPPSKPPEKRGGENQKNRKEEKEKGKEREGFPFPEKMENHSHAAAGAVAEGTAPHRSEGEIAAIFAEAEAIADPTGYEPKDMGEHLAAYAERIEREHPDAVPCPFGSFADMVEAAK